METSNLKKQIKKIIDTDVSDEIMVNAIKKCIYSYEISIRRQAEKLVKDSSLEK